MKLEVDRPVCTKVIAVLIAGLGVLVLRQNVRDDGEEGADRV